MNNYRIRFTLILFLLLFPVSFCFAEQKAEYAVIITIDGLRPDAIEKADTPNLDLLIKEGSFTPSAETDELPKTLPAHTSLVTGLKSKNHGMEENRYRDGLGTTEFPTIFKIARDNGLSTAMVDGKKKLSYIYPESDKSYISINEKQIESVGQTTKWYIDYIKANKPRLSLVHFPYPDIAGHTYSWMSPEYLKSVEVVDASIGEIIGVLKEAGMYGSIFMVITSDHGGHKKTHGNKGEYRAHSLPIPWLAVGKFVKKDYQIKEKVYIYDTTPTVLKALGLPAPGNIDGTAISEIFISD